MNKDAKIGLFAVLILVVLVAVMWAKLAENKDEPTPAPTEVATADQAPANPNTPGTPNADTLMVQNTNTQTGDGYRQGSNPFAPTGNATTTDNKAPVTPGNAGALTPVTPAPVNNAVTSNNVTPAPNGPAGTVDPGTVDALFPGEKKNPTADLGADTSYATPGVTAEWPKQHVVAKGETLAVIAKKYGTSWKTIADANKDVLPDPAKMKIGLKLQVPEPAKKSELKPVSTEDAKKELGLAKVETAKSDSKTSDTPKAGTKYTVKKGDTLISIARSVYGKAGEWKSILNANKDKLPAADRLRVGMVITLPEKL